jgi:hypothetical protein
MNPPVLLTLSTNIFIPNLLKWARSRLKKSPSTYKTSKLKLKNPSKSKTAKNQPIPANWYNQVKMDQKKGKSTAVG